MNEYTPMNDPQPPPQPPQGGQPPQQPPGWNQPPQQPPPGWNPQPPQGPYPYPQPPMKKHTVRNVFLGVLLAGVVLFGGCAVIVGVAVNDAADEIEANDQRPGGADNPLEIADAQVTDGKAFEVDGFNYAAGWSIDEDALGDMRVRGLKVTNNRDDKDSALVEIKMWDGKEVKALADCTTEPISIGTTVKLSCLSADPFPKHWDRVTINDTF
jgi:hypothetical protein